MCKRIIYIDYRVCNGAGLLKMSYIVRIVTRTSVLEIGFERVLFSKYTFSNLNKNQAANKYDFFGHTKSILNKVLWGQDFLYCFYYSILYFVVMELLDLFPHGWFA